MTSETFIPLSPAHFISLGSSKRLFLQTTIERKTFVYFLRYSAFSKISLGGIGLKEELIFSKVSTEKPK